jgi:cytoskeletal protein CcmA (bactofilin family)
MRQNRRATGRTAGLVALVCSIVLALAVVPGAVSAAPQDGTTIVAPDETVTGDLSEITGDVVVHGTVEGDVSAVAGSVEITGEVTGDVSAAAGSVTVEGGTVGGDVSAGGGSIDVTDGATVEGDASAGGGSVTVGPDSTVERDAAAGGGDAEVEGTVDGDVASGQSVVLGANAHVGGDVTYHDSLDRAGGAVVEGTVTHETGDGWQGIGSIVDVDDGSDFQWSFDTPLTPGVVDDGPGWLSGVYWVLLALLAGGVALLLAPDFSAEVATQAATDPLRSGALGFAALVAAPVVLVVVGLTIVGIPFALAGGALFALVAWVGLVFGEYVAGREVLAALDVGNRWAALAVGVVGVELLARLPVMGGLVRFLVFLLGFGALVHAVGDRWRDDNDDEPVEPTPRDGTPDVA